MEKNPIDQGKNVIIETGKFPEIKIFKANSSILKRTKYFRVALSNEWAKRNDDGYYIINKPNINPQTFEIILKFIYNENNVQLNLLNINGPESIQLLIASDELELIKLSEMVQIYLINYQIEWIHQNLEYILKFISIYKSFNIILEYTISCICGNPQLIFGRDNKYLELNEYVMIQILKRDDLELKEIEIWEYLIKWGIHNNNNNNNNNKTRCHCKLSMDISNWTRNEFIELEKILHNCIPLIRYFQISSTDLYDKVRIPFKKILPKQLNEDIIRYYMKPQSKMEYKILPPRRTAIIDSNIIKSIHVALLCSWIDNKENYYYCKNIPYEFKLLCRGSRDGFETSVFHEKCDDNVGTIVLIKLSKLNGSENGNTSENENNTEESEEKEEMIVLGGYNPCTWKNSDNQNKLNNFLNSFIFSFNLKGRGGGDLRKEAKLSRIKIKEEAIYCSTLNGPCFGRGDLWMTGNFGSSKRTSYEFSIIDKMTFFAEDYEVFHIKNIS